MNALVWTGSILALLTYYPLWKQIKSGKAKQNFLTWALFCTGLFCLKKLARSDTLFQISLTFYCQLPPTA